MWFRLLSRRLLVVSVLGLVAGVGGGGCSATLKWEAAGFNGAACTDGADCTNGFCVSGVCCDSACDSPCEVCDATGLEGLCSPAPAGTDPRLDCLGAQGCNGACNGAGGCDYPDQTQPCGLGCKYCDGNGGCDFIPAGADPFAECGGAGAPCGQTCDGTGTCAFAPLGQTCGLGCQECDGAGTCVADCSDNACVQGVSECQCQPQPTTVTCGRGGDVSASLAPGPAVTDLFDTYGLGCFGPQPLDGHEMTFHFNETGPGGCFNASVVVNTAVCGSGAFPLLLDGSFTPCSSTACVAGQSLAGRCNVDGSGQQTLTIKNLSYNTDYWLIVDSQAGQESTFDMTVACTPCTCGAGCNNL